MTEFWIAAATLIGTILFFIQTNKSQKVTYLYEEEAKWRDSLRNIIISLRDSDDKTIVADLNKLTPLLNPLGKQNRKIGHRQAYSVDSHIWLLRGYILEQFDKEKLNKLIDYLELLLKFDWEDSKNKLKYKLFDSFIIFSLFLYCLLFILWIIQPEWIGRDGKPISVILPVIGLFMVLLALGIFCAHLKGKIFFGVTALTAIDQFFVMLFLVCYIIPVVGLIGRYNEKIVEVLQRVSFMSDVNKTNLTKILIGMLFVFEILFLSISTSLKNKYYLSILKADYPYLTKELKSIYYHLREKNLSENNRDYLSRAYSQLEKYFEKDDLLDIPQNISIDKVIDDIDSTYLWQLTSYKKVIKYLIKYKNGTDDRCIIERLKEKWNNTLEKLRIK